MILHTKRLILRPWAESDAECLFEYAKDERVGPITGWPPHTSVENSKEIIQQLLMQNHTFAVALKTKPEQVIGNIGVMLNDEELRFPFMNRKDAEIGFWLGVPYWGNGYIPEAVKRVLTYCFEELAVENIWCGYYEGNDQSKRVQEKVGFLYERTEKELFVPPLNEYRVEHFTKLTKKCWLQQDSVE